MSHPSFPTIVPQFSSGPTYPKLPVDEAMALWDMLDKLGIFVVAKSRMNKSSAPRLNWGSKNRSNYTREHAYNDQLRDDVAGWVALPGPLSNRLCVVDMDPSEMILKGYDPPTVYEEVQSKSESNFIILTPSGGVHLYYRIPEHKRIPFNGTGKGVPGIDIRSDRGIAATLGGFSRYEGAIAKKKGLVDGHCAPYAVLPDGDYTFIPEMSDEMYDWFFAEDHIAAENYGETQEGSARVKAHQAETHDVQVDQTLKLLEVVLAEWQNEDYDAWYRLKMAAHHGSNGDERVMEYFLSHPSVVWSDGEKGRRAFINSWRSHKQRDGGITVGSLYYYARERGWRAKTGAELSEVDVHDIHVNFITDYLDSLIEIPEINLLISQTGSGKTFALAQLYEELGKPQTVVLVPYRKLAVTMYKVLRNDHGLPVVLYLEDDHETTKKTDDLVDAHILVTTLQTFAKKVYPNINMEDIGLVYFEECDQTIRDHATGGHGGRRGSHVSQEEAVRGFACLRDIMNKVEYVWLVDATMTRVSEELVASLVNDREYQKTRNTLVKPKADATMLNDIGEAYELLAEGLRDGKKCVCVTDTVNKAEEAFDLMQKIGALRGKKAILITARTAGSAEVREFMEHVNEKAGEYDLVVYNSVMGSGVSITSVIPDLIVQICTFLPPTRNIQLLNRYRGQEGVELYVYYPYTVENLFPPTVNDLLERAEYIARETQAATLSPIADRDDDALLRDKLTALTQADEEAQRARGKDIYMALLRQDGRKVRNIEDVQTTGTLTHSLISIRQAKKQFREELKSEWPETPPIDRRRKALPDYSPRQVAQGQIHAKIEKVLREVIPKDVDPEEIYDTVFAFSPYLFPLEAFIYRDEALLNAEKWLADHARAFTTFTNTMGLVTLIDLARLLFVEGWEEEIEEDEWVGRAQDFLRELEKKKDAFNSLYEAKDAYGKALQSAKAQDGPGAAAYVLAKKILKRCGMTLSRKSRGRGDTLRHYYVISNLDEVIQFLRWRYRQEPNLNAYTTEIIQQKLAYRQEALELKAEMTPEQKARVQAILEQGMAHADAVYQVLDDPEGLLNDF